MFGSNISKPCPTSQSSIFSLFGGAHNLHRSEGWFSLPRVLFSLLSPNTILSSYLHKHTHAKPKRKVWAFFFSYSKSFCFASFQVCEKGKLCTDSLLFQILSSPPITFCCFRFFDLYWAFFVVSNLLFHQGKKICPSWTYTKYWQKPNEDERQKTLLKYIYIYIYIFIYISNT